MNGMMDDKAMKFTVKAPKLALGGSTDPFAASQSKDAESRKALNSGVMAVGSAFGPVGTAFATAGTAIGNATNKMTKDEFGIYKNKGAEVASRLFDGVGTVQDVFLGGGGSKSGQQKARERKKFILGSQVQNQITQNQEIGAQIQNALPQFQAPAYGRKGMKFSKKATWKSWPGMGANKKRLPVIKHR